MVSVLAVCKPLPRAQRLGRNRLRAGWRTRILPTASGGAGARLQHHLLINIINTGRRRSNEKAALAIGPRRLGKQAHFEMDEAKWSWLPEWPREPPPTSRKHWYRRSCPRSCRSRSNL